MSWERIGWHHRLALHHPERMRTRLQALHAAGLIGQVPTPLQVYAGVLYMRARVLTRPESVGVGSTPMRKTRRARWLALRPVRFPFLVAERVIAPWDLTGFGSSPAFFRRHLLGAYHPHDHAIYDLALLSVLPGVLEELRDEVADIVAGTHPRAAWLADLCVFEGYHANLLVLIDRALAGELEVQDPIPTDTTLVDFVAWMCEQPASWVDLVGPRGRWPAVFLSRQDG